ncbi:hypothetical protein ERJ75_000456000 [Trypanosoma vivax]|nr:hypothetical protein ERJ75_000456000 [Trypanosoma vivax]
MKELAARADGSRSERQVSRTRKAERPFCEGRGKCRQVGRVTGASGITFFKAVETVEREHDAVARALEGTLGLESACARGVRYSNFGTAASGGGDTAKRGSARSKCGVEEGTGTQGDERWVKESET